jgi:hypothetical protein
LDEPSRRRTTVDGSSRRRIFDVPRLSWAHEPQNYLAEHTQTPYDDFDLFAQELTSFLKLSSTDPGGYRVLLIQECTTHILQKENEFKELRIRSTQLERKVRKSYDTQSGLTDDPCYAE